MITNIYARYSYDPIMSGHFCTGFTNFMLKAKSWLDYTNSCSRNGYEKNGKIILK